MIPSAPELGALLLRGPDQPGVGIKNSHLPANPREIPDRHGGLKDAGLTTSANGQDDDGCDHINKFRTKQEHRQVLSRRGALKAAAGERPLRAGARLRVNRNTAAYPIDKTGIGVEQCLRSSRHLSISSEWNGRPRRPALTSKIFAAPLKRKSGFFIFQSPSQDGSWAPDGPGKPETGTGRVRCRL